MNNQNRLEYIGDEESWQGILLPSAPSPSGSTFEFSVQTRIDDVKWQGSYCADLQTRTDRAIAACPFGIIDSDRQEFDWALEVENKLRDVIFRIETHDGTEFTVERVWQRPNIHRSQVRKDLFYDLFAPSNTSPQMLVVVLGGSSGGFQFSRAAAAALACPSIATMAISYFSQDQPQKDLDQIPLEYFRDCWNAALSQLGCRQLPIVVMGRSRGAECALLLSQHFFDVHAAIAYAPGHICWKVFGSNRSSWTLNDRNLASAHLDPDTFDELMQTHSQSIELTPWFDQCTVSAPENTAINLERKDCPVLLLSGSSDKLWNSKASGDFLACHGSHVIHRSYENVGHCFDIPGQPFTHFDRNLPIGPKIVELGGDLAATLAAESDSWRLVQEFLQKLKKVR